MTRRYALVLAFIAALAAVYAAAQTPTSANRESAAIRAVLDLQVAAWNAGKLDEFMTGYWKSPELSFFSGNNKLAGWDATIARYRRNYQSEGKEMGRLVFSDLDIQPLGADAAYVRGRFELTFRDGSKPTGIFTLIFRRFDDGWKIVHDHTSS